ncbi:hypothetical protein ONS96_007266 [Cadophora gregata f. sp. sojae]|nr:hypothetical protein ONS96_007266 [Cadophora gregata f. sp. sojae]
MLCQICQERIFHNGSPTWTQNMDEDEDGDEDKDEDGDEDEDETEWALHHKDFETFDASIKEGCFICNRVWASLQPSEQLSISDREEAKNDNSKSSDTQHRISPDPELSTLGTRDCLLEYQILEDVDLDQSPNWYRLRFRSSLITFTEAPKLVINKIDASIILEISEIPANSKSAESFSLARDWITECDKLHKSCQAAAAGTYYPTRLLDCGLPGSPESCRVIESKSASITGPYLTLSHCWGHTECLKITTTNYNELLTDIPVSSLPLLYQDAVHATRQLQHRYIDWQQQVTLMSEVYSHAACNISAATSPNAEHSMFNSRDSTQVIIETLDLSINSQDVSKYVIRDENIWSHNPWLWINEVREACVNGRGWVLQERVLSVRNLYFGKSQLYWECHEKDAMEVWPAGLPSYFYNSKPRIKSLLQHGLESVSTINNDLEWLKAWNWIVRTYSFCGLTKSSDKLPAISSLVKRLRSSTNDEYVVGLWRSVLPQQLFWETLYQPPPLKDYRAPSWSWAAVDGLVTYDLKLSRPLEALVTVEGLEIDYLTDDDTQQVNGGWLGLRGKLRTITLTRSDKSMWINSHEWYGANIWFDTIGEPFDGDTTERSVYGLPVCLYTADQNGDEGEKPKDLYALILHVVDKGKGIYRRIGYWYASISQEHLDEILGFTDGEEEFPCEKYEDGYHYIRII